MSLIHEALKKAQRPASPQGAPFSQGVHVGERGSPIARRTALLSLFFLGALGFLVWEKFLSHHKTTGSTMLPQVQSEAEESRRSEFAQLQEQGVIAFHNGDFNTAWARFTAASALVADDPELWNNLGVVSRRKGDIAKARAEFEKALALKPDYPECLNNLAVLDMDEGKWELAKARLDKAIEINADYGEAKFHLGVMAERAGEIEVAARYYRAFLKTARSLPSHVLDQVRDHVLDIEP